MDVQMPFLVPTNGGDDDEDEIEVIRFADIYEDTLYYADSKE